MHGRFILLTRIENDSYLKSENVFSSVKICSRHVHSILGEDQTFMNFLNR
jgi:hypothetical protein